MDDTFLRGMTVRFGVFFYAGVEPIDLATFGVLSMARRLAPQIEIVRIATEKGPLVMIKGLDGIT